jgi:hypothetical protein
MKNLLVSIQMFSSLEDGSDDIVAQQVPRRSGPYLIVPVDARGKQCDADCLDHDPRCSFLGSIRLFWGTETEVCQTEETNSRNASKYSTDHDSLTLFYQK